ncbi:MAG TPA: bL35 family ribosomal protein [Candidatus Paceibacterota bacterium]
MKNSVSDRIRITKTGKILRRPMGVNHFRAKKTSKQRMSKRGTRSLVTSDVRIFRKYL